MLYSSSFDALKKSLVGVHKFIQAGSLHVIDFFAIFEKNLKKENNDLLQATDLSEASEGEVGFVFSILPSTWTHKKNMDT